MKTGNRTEYVTVRVLNSYQNIYESFQGISRDCTGSPFMLSKSVWAARVPRVSGSECRRRVWVRFCRSERCPCRKPPKEMHSDRIALAVVFPDASGRAALPGAVWGAASSCCSLQRTPSWSQIRAVQSEKSDGKTGRSPVCVRRCGLPEQNRTRRHGGPEQAYRPAAWFP